MTALYTTRWATSTMLASAVVGMVCLVGMVGCDNDTRRVNGGRVVGSAGAGQSSRMLLTTVANQLADLPEQSVLELRPPSVVLDAKKSRDGQDVMAKLVVRDPKMPYDYALRIVSDNASFANVRPGDILRWYGKFESEVDNEFGNSQNQLTTSIMLNILDAPPEERRAAIDQFSRGSDPAFKNMLAELKRILALPPERQQEIKQAIEDELAMQGDIISGEAYELTVAQVSSGPNPDTVLFDPAKMTQAEFLMMPRYDEAVFRLEAIRYRDARFQELIIDNKRYAKRGVPLLGWEPSPDQMATKQMVERLNQWLRQATTTTQWVPTPLLQNLPEPLRDHKKLSLLAGLPALERNAFSLSSEALEAVQAIGYEGRLLQEASWMRDIGRWVTLGETEPARQVDRLFDWTIRTLQLDESGDHHLPYRPWQLLAHGHATAEGRAWVLAQLCRQIEVPVVVFRPAGDQGPLWCGALVEGELLLYDPQLGLPLHNADANTATLQELAANPQLAKQFDDEGEAYLPETADFTKLEFQIVAGPFSLSRRAVLLEERLTGNDALLLFVDTAEISAQLQQAVGSVQQVALWPHPFQTIADQLDLTEGTEQRLGRTDAALEFEPYIYRPRLWKARLLHFRGSEGEMVDSGRGNLKTEIHDHRDAGRLYTHSKVRPTQATIDQQQALDLRRAWTTAKQNATYWQGLLSYDRGDYRIAADWLKRAAELERWKPGAVYNLARALEALGETDQAIELLEQSIGPQARGNQLRAQRLRAE